ncbi:MAG: hypothetical protein H6605_07095 [Flavobacteriales bacterium]|nr:hypothetical protein [Flavobacteriales bacterium]
MKSVLRYTIKILILFLGTAQTFAQISILESFTGFENNRKIYLNWVIETGSSCNGIRILRSVNGIEFTEIGHIPGICGGGSSPVPFDFIDVQPVPNAINYYKLQLGAGGYSQVISFEVIDFQQNGFQIRPNPVKDHGRIYFPNFDHSPIVLKVYDSSGMLIDELFTRDEFFELYTENFITGLYYFKIFKNNTDFLLSGKFMVCS